MARPLPLDARTPPAPDDPSVNPPNTLRAAQKRFTRERLIAAAVEEFAVKGYSATTVSDITDRARATRATFYLHFDSKASLVEELATQWNSDFEPLWDLLRDLPPRPRKARVRRWLMTATAAWSEKRPLTAVVTQAIAAEPTLTDWSRKRFDEELEIFVSAIRHLGWEDDAHARLEAMLLFAQLERTFYYWSLSDSTLR